MSRVGRMPIDIPAGVNVNLDGHVITVKGPKGELTRTLHQDMKVTINDNVITVERPSDDKNHRALHGLTRALVANMVKGVSEGFKKELEIVGVGYRAQMKGKKLALTLGFSHPLELDARPVLPSNARVLRRSTFPVQTTKLSVNSLLKFAATVSLNRIRAKVSVMLANMSVVKPVKLVLRNKI